MAHFVNFKWQPNSIQSNQNLEKLSHFTKTTQQTNFPNNYTPFKNVINQPQFFKQQNPIICVVQNQQDLPSQKSIVQNLLFQSNTQYKNESIYQEQQECQIQYNEQQQSELEQSIVEQLYDPLINQSGGDLDMEDFSEHSYDFAQSSDIYATQIEQQKSQNKQAFDQMQKIFFEELNKMDKKERDNIVETLLQLEESQMHEFIVYLMDQKNTKKNSDKIRQSIVYAKELQIKHKKKQFEIQKFETLKYKGKKSKNLEIFNFQIFQPSSKTHIKNQPKLSNILLKNFSQLFSSNLSKTNSYLKDQYNQVKFVIKLYLNFRLKKTVKINNFK